MIPSTQAMDRPLVPAKTSAWRVAVLVCCGGGLLAVVALALPAFSRWSQADRAVDGARLRIAEVTRGDLEGKCCVVKLPRGPFLESGGWRLAYVVEGGLARERQIVVGAVSAAEVEILKGLQPGDKVVLSDTSSFEGAGTVLIRN